MSRDTSLRQRPRRRYQFSQHGQSEQGQRHGNYLIANNQADLWSPAYGQGVTTIRVFPAKSLDNPNEWDPYRFPSTDPHDPLGFGDWIRRYPAVRSMGDPPVTFIQHDPADPQIEDPQMTPGWLLFRAIDRAVAQGQDRPGWAALLRGSRGRGAQLSRPSEVYLVQCAIMQYKNRAYSPPKGFGQDDKLVVMELGPSAGLAMLNECHREVEGYQGDPDDLAARYANGDPISLDAGRFVNFYTLKDGDPRQAQQVAAGGWNSGGGGQGGFGGGNRGGRGGNDEPIGYGCFMEEQFNGIPARLRDFESAVASRVRNWDEILRFPTIEEQAHLLADKFPPEVIEYAWSSHPEWIPEEVRRRARAAVSVGVQGGFPTPDQQAQHAQGMDPNAQPQHSGQMPAQGAGWGAGPAATPQATEQPQVDGGGFPTQQAPPGQQGGWGQPQGSAAAPPQQQAPVETPPQQPPVQPQQPMMPQQQPAPQNPPTGDPSQGGMMGWGAGPNVAQQPDPAIAPGSIPAAQDPLPQQPAQQPQQPAAEAQSDVTPPENNQPGQGFDPQPAQPAAGGAMTPAQAALQRAQQARDAQNRG